MPSSTAFRILALSIASVLCMAHASAAPPTVGPERRIDVNGGTFSASETSSAAVEFGSTAIVGTWNDWRDSPTVSNEVIRMGVALSTNGGATWDDFVVRPPAPNQSGAEGDPMTAADPRTGALWVGAIGFSGNGGLYVARKDAGDNFFQPSVMADAGGGVDKCWMVAGRNNITPDSTRLYITYNFGVVLSDDMGDTWTNPTSLGSGLGFQPRIGFNGHVFVAYWNFTNERFELKRSFNGGQSFTTRTITQRMDTWGVETFNTRFAGTFRVASLPAIAVKDDPEGGSIYAVWPDTTDMPGGQANVDVYFARTDDNGETWTTPIILNGEGPFIGDQFFPWIEIDEEGRLHVVYLDSRHTDQNDNTTHGMFDAYYAYSEDEGDTWHEIRLTDESWDSDDDGLNRSAQFIGDYLGMAVSGTTVWPTYISSKNGDLDVYTREISFTPCDLPGTVGGLALELSEDDSTLSFSWVNEGFVFNYVLFEDVAPDGAFEEIAAEGASGFIGIDVPAPDGDRYYLIAARNGCGIGPKQEPEPLP